MNDKIMDARRAGFEAIWNSDLRWRNHRGMFEGEKEISKEIWNAALDSVVVELPKPRLNEVPYRELVIEAIHAAGVRTK